MANNFFRFSFICGFVGLLSVFRITYVNSIECGTTDFTRKLILKGTQTERGEYPFLAALFLVEYMQFICGGSLISAKHVLTAAHCTKDHGIMFFPDDLIVLLGSYDLTSRIERDAVHRDVAEIRVHPDWNVYSEKLDADLAILILSEIVAFTNFIRPVCMPAENSVISGAKGTIVGWGLTENGTQAHLTYPKHAVTNALNDTYCYTTDYVAAKLSSYRTFCGGGEATSPNRGDSGGGFFVLLGRAWVQYGVISALRTDATGSVDEHSIAIYTNVKEFNTWINDTVRESGGEVGEAMKKIEIQLNCEYSYGGIDINLYGCWVYDVDIRSDNFEVVSFTGSHLDGKTDEDVGLLQFRNGTMFYVPDGIGNNNFENIKQLEIEKSLNAQLIRRSNFKYLKSLIAIDIFKNDIKTIEEDSLWDLPHLEIFKLVENKLREIDEVTFVNNSRLREIYLYKNHLESIPKNLFQQNLLLEIVSVVNNNLKAIAGVTFDNNPKLREIHLYANHLESIPRNLLQKNFLLEVVSLNQNNLKTINEVTFVNNPKLKEIYLYKNRLESIPKNLFQQNLLLESLRLDGNNLKTIDEVTFVNNTKLREIYLYENHLESIPRNLFQENSLLEVASLHQNNFKTIDEVIFVNNPKLSQISLNEVNLESIPRNLFQKNFLLEKVWLHKNNLKLIDEVTFVNNPKLREIYLYANHLESIPKNLFQQNLFLEKVSLQQNNLKTIDEVTFVNNPKLREIYLRDNQLESIPRNLFQKNFLLEIINFLRNSIKIIEADFTVFKYIKNIYLHSNVCFDGYYDGTEDPNEYHNTFRNLFKFQEAINVNCSLVKS